MEYKTLSCAEHGGTFKVIKKAGRPPRNCSEDNRCSAAKGSRQAQRVNRAQADRPENLRKPTRAEVQAARLREQTGRPVRATKGTATVATEPVVNHNPSVPLAYEAKKLLEPQGWALKGSAWVADDGHFASVIGQRGSETITLLWRNAKLVSQEYIMFTNDRPTMNGMPKSKLDFDPDELSDVALIKRISGRRVWWWNPLGKRVESAEMPRREDQRVKVEHLMNGHGEEEVRVISFVDQTANHKAYRAFHASALLKIS